MHALLPLLTLPLLALSAPAPAPSSTSASANHALVKNSCPYSVYINSVSGAANAKNSATDRSQVIAPGSTYTEAFRNPGVGISLKVSNGTSASAKVMQFEYTMQTDGQVWYDLSFIDCLNGVASYDASKCAGFDYGVKATAGQGCMSYTCPPGEVCAGQAYWLQENGYQDGAPVSQCAASKGLTFELCYSNA